MAVPVLKSENKSSRDPAIDALRVAACFAVVGLHTFAKDTSLFGGAFYYACGFAVPSFFMASGAILLNRGGQPQVSKKGSRILRVVIVWIMLTAAAKFIKAIAETGLFSAFVEFPLYFVRCAKGSLLQSGPLSHLWFLWSLAFIYLLCPTLIRLSRRLRFRVMLGLLVFGSLTELISYLAGYPLPSVIPQAFRIWTWMKYFLLGGFLYSKKKELLRAEVGRWFPLLLGVFSLIWQMYAGKCLLVSDAGITHAEYFYDSLIVSLSYSAFFISLISGNAGDAFCSHLVGYTMGIYMLHKFTIKVLLKFVPQLVSVFAGIPLFVLVAAITLSILLGLSRLLPKVYTLLFSL